jgi:hypothetical protein
VPAAALSFNVQLAISYRWQEHKVALSADCSVNMSTWQLTQVRRILSKCNCMYVWIDHISVPQDGSDVQNTLLSRMMGVYASAGLTLALRSVELDQNRYHQRGKGTVFLEHSLPFCYYSINCSMQRTIKMELTWVGYRLTHTHVNAASAMSVV